MNQEDADDAILARKMQIGLVGDRQHILIKFLDEHDDWRTIFVQRDNMRQFVAQLIDFTSALAEDEVLHPDQDATPTPVRTLPATETQLMFVRTVGLVRGQGGGAILHATTSLGINLRLGLSPALEDGLRDALNADLPAG